MKSLLETMALLKMGAEIKAALVNLLPLDVAKSLDLSCLLSPNELIALTEEHWKLLNVYIEKSGAGLNEVQLLERALTTNNVYINPSLRRRVIVIIELLSDYLYRDLTSWAEYINE
jgi:hypothetical protein